MLMERKQRWASRFNKDEVLFYTGLSNIYLLLILFEFVSSDIQHHSQSALTVSRVFNDIDASAFESYIDRFSVRI